MSFGSKNIVKEIGSDKVELFRVVDHGYWYFVYDDSDNKRFETYSVSVPFLNQMSLERWVEIGKLFVEAVEKDPDFSSKNHYF